jgi:hypothetical protein
MSLEVLTFVFKTIDMIILNMLIRGDCIRVVRHIYVTDYVIYTLKMIFSDLLLLL